MNKFMSIYSRIVLGLMLGVLVSSYINAQNQISDEALVALAKQKQDKIKPEDFVKFEENYFLNSKDAFIKYKIHWYEENKDMFRRLHNAMYDTAQKGSKFAQEVVGDPNISRETWIAKFDKDWDPKKAVEMELQKDKDDFQRQKSEIVKALNSKTHELSEIIKGALFNRNYPEDDPRRSIYRNQLKQWLEKY